jgi:DNA-binding XRE family transcriptional regulator
MPAPEGNKYAVGNPGGGRPTVYKPEYVELAYNYCLLGATDADLATYFDVTEQTINAWKHDHPDFFLSLKQGKEEADAKVAASLFKKATGYKLKEQHIIHFEGEVTEIVEIDKEYPPDTTSMIFWLKNRQPKFWRDKQEVQHSGSMVIFNNEDQLED